MSVPNGKAAKPPSWHMVAYLTLPATAWLSISGAAAALLALRLPLWAAIPLGLILGALFFGVWLLTQGGTSTVVELNVASVLLLLLAAVLVPVVVKARHNAQHRHHQRLHPTSARTVL